MLHSVHATANKSWVHVPVGMQELLQMMFLLRSCPKTNLLVLACNPPPLPGVVPPYVDVLELTVCWHDYV
jgi:hypothetical protein